MVVSCLIALFIFHRYFSIARNGEFQDRNNQDDDNNGGQRFASM